MFKDGVLTIDHDTWKDGIASSPYVGCGELRNADIFSKRGALRCGFEATKETDTLITDFVRFMRHDEDNEKVYAADDSGKLYIRSGGTWSEALHGEGIPWSEANECQGLALWKGYLLLAEDETLAAFDINSFWYDAWQSFAEGRRGVIDLPHVMHVGQDDVVYITDGKYIASLQETPGETFDANDPSTYTWNSQALDLPDGYVASSLAEVGEYLVIGSYYAAALNRGNRAYLFPWNRTAASFGIPQRTNGNGVWQTITQGNVLYTLVDRRNAKVYASNLTTLELQRELRRISNELRLHPDAVEAIDDELLFGIGSDEEGTENCGVYSFREGAMQLRNTVSAGDANVEIGSVLNIGEGKLLISWTDGTNHGVDLVSDTRCDGYATVLETPLYTVGTALHPGSLQQIDVQLGKALAEGQGVRVSYRERLGDGWTEIKAFDFATFGAVSHMNDKTGTSDLRTIQLKIEVTAASNSTDSPELLSVTLF